MKQFNPSDEYQIIQQCIDGHKESYAILVERYKNMVFNLAYKMIGDTEAAKDVSQDSFLSAYVELKNFKNNSKFSSWLYTIALNKCRDHLKSKKETISFSEVVEMTDPCLLTPERELYRRNIGESLQKALSLLPVNYREVILLKHFSGMDYEEMAKILGIKATALKVQTHRGREMLKKILSDMGVLNGKG